MMRSAIRFHKNITSFKVTDSSQIGLVGWPVFNFASTTSATSFADRIHHEMKNIKVAPSTWFYFLNYGVLPSQVKATGPRGYLTKADLINFITGSKLSKRRVEDSDTQALSSSQK